ncbi:MAG: secondary thiamine-phosphate synthase enzyme YjbQ [Clostridia bacterium]|nr:secondary thiamine-phosphate synthase enzyme YjbQ [Clostridia bacterium]
MYKYSLETDHKGFYRITDKVEDAINKSGVKEGLCFIFCPHTTAGITINENADIFVDKDVTLALDKVFPRFKEFQHDEGNSDGHVKSSVIGAGETIIIENGKPVLGRWQDIYFMEFDPPRSRQFFVKIIEG